MIDQSGAVIEFMKASTPVLVVLLIVIVGLVGWFGRSIIGDLKETITKVSEDNNANIVVSNERIQDLERYVHKFERGLPHNYMLKDDAIRYLAAMEKKIDSTNETIRNLASDVKTLIRGTAKRSTDAES